MPSSVFLLFKEKQLFQNNCFCFFVHQIPLNRLAGIQLARLV